MPAEYIKSSLSQIFAVLAISAVIYLFNRYLFFRKSVQTSFFNFLGIQGFRNQLDQTYLFILIGLVAYGIVSTYAQFTFSDSFRSMLLSDGSPYGKILKATSGITALLSGFFYCFFQASASEELLFRGLIAKRLYLKLGYNLGNIIQSFLFWIMHLLIFRLVTGDWISIIQIFAFLTSFFLGLVLGYVNFRKNGESIGPSWIIHGSVNFACFVTLSFLI